jgi:transcriptional regulator with XRE-family HTH domain
MPPRRPDDWLDLIQRAQRSLGLSKVDIAKHVGVSPRTVTRWFMGHTSISAYPVGQLAHVVHATDPALAAEMWSKAAAHIASLGLHPLAPLPKTASPEPATASRAASASRAIVEVVHAAADAADLSPRATRRVIAAAARRARELGVTLDEVATALDADLSASGTPPSA